jgi:uncharacterized pyridoxamine 5'-phosphate oxidase family protein
MFDFTRLLRQNPLGVMATQDGAGVSTRAFQYLFSVGNKAYFYTSSEKRVYWQLKRNPHVSFCTYPPDFQLVLSISGIAHFVDEIALKDRVLDENPLIKRIFRSSDNPLFKLFFIDVTHVNTYSEINGPNSYKVCQEQNS